MNIVGGCCGTTPEHIKYVLLHMNSFCSFYRGMDNFPSLKSYFAVLMLLGDSADSLFFVLDIFIEYFSFIAVLLRKQFQNTSPENCQKISTEMLCFYQVVFSCLFVGRKDTLREYSAMHV